MQKLCCKGLITTTKEGKVGKLNINIATCDFVLEEPCALNNSNLFGFIYFLSMLDKIQL